MYLFLDHLIWLSSSGFINLNHMNNELAQNSNRFWLFSIMLNLCRDVYEILEYIKARAQSSLSHNINYVNELFYIHKSLAFDFFKNFCDFWIPLNSLGYVKISPEKIGLLGTISSVIAIIQLIDPSCRL